MIWRKQMPCHDENKHMWERTDLRRSSGVHGFHLFPAGQVAKVKRDLARSASTRGRDATGCGAAIGGLRHACRFECLLFASQIVGGEGGIRFRSRRKV